MHFPGLDFRRWLRSSRRPILDKQIKIEPLEPRIAPATINVSGAIASGSVWTSDNIYRITADATLAAGATLTINPGVTVMFNEFAGVDLLIDGTVNASGTAGAGRILFTAVRDETGLDGTLGTGDDRTIDGTANTNGGNGDWGHIRFSSTSSATLSNIEVRFGGASALGAEVVIESSNVSLSSSVIRNSSTSGLRIAASNPTLATDTFQNNTGSAISMDLASNPAITSATTTNNGINGLTLDSGTLTGARFWDDPSIVYRIAGDVTVAAGATLTVGAGQIVKVRPFNGDDLLVNGTLIADGAPGSQIIFTSDRDDTLGGDTNNNGATTGGHGDWNTITFGANSTGNVMDNVQVRFAGAGGPAAVVLSGNNGLSLTNSLIRASSTNGLRIATSNPTVTANTFQDNGISAISMDLASNPAITGVTVTNNTFFNGLTLDSGTLSGSRFWDDPDIAYHIAGDVTVDTGATLTIGAGQLVKVRPFNGDDLFVNGTLIADGTPGAQIVFTSNRDDTVGGDSNNNGATTGANGDWNTITFGANSSGNVMDNVQVRFAGAGGPAAVVLSGNNGLALTDSIIRASSTNGVRIATGNPTLTTNTFQDNFFSAVSMDLASNPAISGVTVTNNGFNGLTLDPGALTGSRFWNDPDIVYRIAGDITVATGATLTVGAGQVVKVRPFNGDDLFVNGTLIADGGPGAQQIIFTSDRDDTVVGDSNNNGATTGGHGDWNTITFGIGSTGNVMDNVQVRFAGAGGPGAVVLSGSNGLALTNSLIRASSTNGLRIVASNPTLTTNSFQDNTFSAVSMDLASNPAISGVTTTNNGINGLTLDAGTLTGTRFWNDPDIVYRIAGDITVAAGATLHVAAGQIVKVRPFNGDDLIVNGTLVADGDPAAQIIFTSDRDDTGRDGIAGNADDADTNNNGATLGGNGDWNSITFGAGSTGNVMDNVQVRFSGASATAAVILSGSNGLSLTNSLIRHSSSNGVRIVASDPVLTGVTFQNNSFSAVSMDLVSNPAITGVTVSGNGANSLTVDAGTLTGMRTWNDPAIVYRLNGDLIIDTGATLTIAAGQVVKARAFAGDDIIVNGTLLANGTPLQRVIFTSDRDDSVLGDTNNNGATTGGNGDWNGIQFTASSTGSVLASAEVRFAGAGSAGGAVVVIDSDATVRNSIITRSSTHGLVARTSATVTAQNNIFFSNSDTGIRAETSATVSAFNNTIDGNFRGLGADGGSITATNNLITNHSRSGVFRTGTGSITTSFNDVLNPTASSGNYEGLSDPTGTGGNISSDPKYVGRATGDFRLLSGSGAIDAATSTGAPTTDLFGNARFDDPGIANIGGGTQPFFDIGAIERQDVSDPLNLVTENVSVTPASIGIGGAITITWTVRNNESQLAPGNWVDAVFASTDAIWSLDDVLVGQVPHMGGLAAGASYPGQLDTTAPASTAGELFFIVRADARQQLRESVETDNDASDSLTLDVPVLVVDTPTAAQFGASGEADYYRVTIAAGGTLLLKLDRAGLGGATELYVRKDAIPSTAKFDFKTTTVLHDQELLIPTTEAGTYYILALGKTVPGAPRDYSIEASFIPFGARSVSPSTAGNGGTATFIVQGGQLEALDSIVLRAPDNTTRAPLHTLIQDNATVIVQFDLTGLAPGAYDLVLDNNGALSSLEDSVQVVAATPSQVDVQFSAPGFLRPQRAFTATVTYSNTGNNDAAIPLFFLDSNGEARLGLSPDNLGGTKLDVIPPPRNGPAGLLKPGESATVTIYGELLAGAGTSVDLDLDIVRPDSSPVNLALVEEYLDVPLATAFGAANEAFARKLLQAAAGTTNAEFVRNMHVAAAGTDDVLSQPVPLTVTEVWKGLLQVISYIIELGITEQDIIDAQGPAPSSFIALSSVVAADDHDHHDHEDEAGGIGVQSENFPSGTEIRTRHVGTSGRVRYVLSGFIASESNGGNDQTGGYGSDHWVHGMAEALHCVYPDDTIKVVNWNSGSGTGLVGSVLAGAGAFGGAGFFAGGGPIGGAIGGIYGAVAGGYTYYKLHARNTPQVGVDIAADIMNSGDDPGSVSIYGHSLGAQTAGHAGRELNGRVGNIVAFDAAGPEFSGNRDSRIDQTDAQNVTAFNTSSSFGTNKDFGHTNYYPEHSRILTGAHAESHEFYRRALDKRCEEIMDGLVPPGTDPEINAPGNSTKPEDDIRDWTTPSNTRRVSTQIVASRDPNDITGPLGFGAPRWIVPDTEMPFTIRFENDPDEATAAAQEVFITQTLDADLDWSTFEFGQFGFASTSVPVARGQQTFSTQVESENADGSPVIVDVTGTFDVATGEIDWVFRSLDPETGLAPADPFAGFLLINDAMHRGEGFVSYFIRPLAAAANNTPLNSIAEIVFDTNEEIVTPEWVNTIDSAAPVSSITTASGNAPGLSFPLTWQGTDTNGSGVATYDVFVSDNNGPFTRLLDDTTLTSTTFNGQLDHTYRFFTVATDNVGFVEAAPLNPDATITVTAMTDADGKVTLTDDDGDIYTVKLTGGGTLKYLQKLDPAVPTDDRGPLALLIAENTTAKSKLSVSVKKVGDGFVSIDSVNVMGGTGGLAAFAAAKSDLGAGGFDATGLVKSLAFRDLAAGAEIEFGGLSTDKTKIAARNLLGGFGIDTSATIASLKAADIDDGTIEAAALSKLQTTIGGMDADLTITGIVGAVAVKTGVNAGNWSGTQFGAIAAGGPFEANIDSLGAIAKITVKNGGLSGDLSARSFGPISVTGGNFSGELESKTAALTLGRIKALAALTVAGGDINGDVQVLGNAGKITAKASKTGLGGNMTDATIIARTIAALTVAKNVTDSMVIARETNLGADNDFGGGDDTFGPGSIASVSVKGTVSGGVIGAGFDAVNGTLGDSDDDIVGIDPTLSFITKLSVVGASPDAYFAAGVFKKPPVIGGTKITDPGSDSRFLVG